MIQIDLQQVLNKAETKILIIKAKHSGCNSTETDCRKTNFPN